MISNLWVALSLAVQAEKNFQIDASYVALLAHQIAAFRKSANQRLSSKHEFENQPELSLHHKRLLRRAQYYFQIGLVLVLHLFSAF